MPAFRKGLYGVPNLIRGVLPPVEMGREPRYIKLSRQVPALSVVMESLPDKPLQPFPGACFADRPVGFKLLIPPDFRKQPQPVYCQGFRITPPDVFSGLGSGTLEGAAARQPLR